ncbi:uncharacterized protein LOC134529570 [Bacillus rossius redtenbacheri]|uniref:uncharacterized protein LOC134529570 n=1 Tax=Bacillus rossius redtenbacheri TaxID=93214 RepID=UPI002FDE423D
MTSRLLLILSSMFILDFALPSDEPFLSTRSLDDVSVDWLSQGTYDHLDADAFGTSNSTDTEGFGESVYVTGSGFMAGGKPALRKEVFIYRPMMEAMRRPGMSEFLGQVLPILRSMSPPQRLVLAALLSANVMTSSASLSLDQVVAMFTTGHDQHKASSDVSSDLLLPISVDIANTFHRASRDEIQEQKEMQKEKHVPLASNSRLEKDTFAHHRVENSPASIKQSQHILTG